MICDLPNKIFTTIGFDLALYFMTNLRRTPASFFIFLLFTFTCTLTMSMYFRSIAAMSRSLPEVSSFAVWLAKTRANHPPPHRPWRPPPSSFWRSSSTPVSPSRPRTCIPGSAGSTTWIRSPMLSRL